MSDGGPLTREEAPLALNDHIGQQVEVIVQAGVQMAMAISTQGTLYHWREHGRAERWVALARGHRRPV